MASSPNARSASVAGQDLSLLLLDIHKIIENQHNIAREKFSLSNVEVDILFYIVRYSENKMRDIGKSVNVKLSNLTNIVDRLEQLKLVKRVNSKTDRRSISLQITPKGQKLLEDYNLQVQSFADAVERAMPSEQVSQVIKGLEKMVQLGAPALN